MQCGELRRRAKILSCDERDGLHLLAAQLHAELALLRGLTFGAAITGILIVRVAGEARYHGVEAFPSRGEINNGGEYRGIVVEKKLHPL